MRIEILKNQREHFEKACAEYSIDYEIFTNEKNSAWFTVMLPELTPKEVWHLCMSFNLGIREEIVSNIILF